METLKNLIFSEEKAKALFFEIENRGLIVAGKSEKTLNTEIYNLAMDMFGINKFWHKRIVRAGKNTLCPYQDNPPDLILRANEILFLDFGPVFEEWEADLGRTYVLGDDSNMLKMQADVEKAWHEGYEFYKSNAEQISGAEFYNFSKDLAIKYGWEFGHIHCGHLIGKFPHEKILGEDSLSYIHPDNNFAMSSVDVLGNQRFWIYEIHFVDKELQIGGFYEQLMRP